MRTNYNLYTGVTKIKSKFRRYTNKLTFGIAAGVASIGLAIIPMASAASTVTVSPSNLHNWYNAAPAGGGSVDFVNSANAPIGKGALQLTTMTDASYTRFRNDTINMPLSNLNALTYQTKQISGNPSTADVNLRLYIATGDKSCGTGAAYDDVLVFEPYYNNASQQPIVTNTWQSWNGMGSTGYWWSNCGFTYNNSPTPPPAGGYSSNFHLSDVLAQYPDASIVSVGLGTGDSNSPWVVQADALQVNDTIYNFEPDALPQDQCKDGGWKNMSVNGSKSFKNQGDCVSYYVSNGKNQPSGH